MLHAVPSHLAWFNIQVNEKYEKIYVIQAKDYYHLFDRQLNVQVKDFFRGKKDLTYLKQSSYPNKIHKLNNPQKQLL